MIKRFRKFIVLFVTATFSFFSFSFVDSYFEISKNLDIFSTLYRELNLYYVDSIAPDKVIKKGIDAMLESLDPYTNFIPETEIDNYRFMTSGTYGGIGATIRKNGDHVAISEPYEGFPAQQNDLRAGDLIVEVDGRSMQGKTTDEVSRSLKGKPGTGATLVVKREGELLEKNIIRQEIKIKNVAYSGMLENGIAYIKLSSFTEGAAGEVKEALKKIRQHDEPKGLILDLRNNPGGLLNEAVNISNIFVSKGCEIVSTKGKMKDLNKSYKAINETTEPLLPVTVLVNSSSASASEIVSGSLQDFDRAIIIGQRTFGKGLVQTTRPLSYNTQLKITTSRYYIPSGRCIQARDYTHRNEDGSVGKIPDSLMKVFKTQGGRKVYDGGGILPDLNLPLQTNSSIMAILLGKNLIFDFATSYRNTHAEIASAEQFRLTTADFETFKKFVSGREKDFLTATETELEKVKKSSEEDKYFDSMKAEYDAMKVRLSLCKMDEVEKSKSEIMEKLREEIVSRYYFQSGRIRSSLPADAEFKKAVEVITTPDLYQSLLKGPVTPDEEPKTMK